MVSRRSDVIWGRLLAQAAVTGAAVGIADVCAVAAASVSLGGVWVALARNGEPDMVICVTDPVAERLAEFQLTLGEGPGHDVLTSAAPMRQGLAAWRARRATPAPRPMKLKAAGARDILGDPMSKIVE